MLKYNVKLDKSKKNNIIKKCQCLDCGLLGYLEDEGVRFIRNDGNSVQDRTYILTYLITYLLTYSLHTAESFLRS